MHIDCCIPLRYLSFKVWKFIFIPRCDKGLKSYSRKEVQKWSKYYLGYLDHPPRKYVHSLSIIILASDWSIQQVAKTLYRRRFWVGHWYFANKETMFWSLVTQNDISLFINNQILKYGSFLWLINNPKFSLEPIGWTFRGANQKRVLNWFFKKNSITIYFERGEHEIQNLTNSTTVNDVIYAMIKTGNELLKNLSPSQLVIVESWRKVERPLPPRTRILKVWKSWRSEQKYVRYFLKPAHR